MPGTVLGGLEVQSHFEILSRPVKPRRTNESKGISSAVDDIFISVMFRSVFQEYLQIYKIVVIVLCYDGHASSVPPFVLDFTFPLCPNTSGEGDVLSKLFLLVFHNRSVTAVHSNAQAVSPSVSLASSRKTRVRLFAKTHLKPGIL